MPEPDPVPTPGADGLSAEPEGSDWLVTFGPFGSGIAGVALLTAESEPGPETGAEAGVGAAVGPGSTVGAATGAVVPDSSGATLEGRSGALVESRPGVAEDPGLAGVAEGSGPAGVDAGTGVEAGCEAATWVVSGDHALGAPGELEAPPAAEDAVRAESAGGEPTAVSAEDLDRGVTRTRAGVPM
jgi:hypothetical protein